MSPLLTTFDSTKVLTSPPTTRGGAFIGRPRRQETARRSKHAVRPSARMNIVESEIDGNFVAAPSRKQPRGVVHFLGGAFAGAAPQLAYQCLIRWLADAGYTVVATPYKVTFRHLDCAASVHQAFTDTLLALRTSGQGWMAPARVPIHGVGHSNGALLHLLIGSQLQPPHASNVIISYNNKQVKEAIPIPLNGLQGVVKSARASSLPSMFPTTDEILDRAVAFSAATRGVLDRSTANALRPAIDQIGSVLDEVEQGYVDFIPTPLESRQIISGGYRMPATLLVQFSDDSIDETPQIASALQRPGESGPTVLRLPGSHVTPCGGDITWQVGPVFTPADAVALAAKAVLQTDLRRTTRKIVSWLDEHS